MKKLTNKKMFALLLCLVMALTAMFTVTAFADTEPAADAAMAQTEAADDSSVTGSKATASAIGSFGLGLDISKSVEGNPRQPEAEAKIRTTMMLGLVFLETVVIYALLTVILIIFVL